VTPPQRSLVTGAAAAIGPCSATQLVPGKHLVLVGGGHDERAAARDRVVASGAASTDTQLGDSTLLDPVRVLACKVVDTYDHIEVLINDADTVHATRSETVDGCAASFGVNHLARHRFTDLLEPGGVAADRLICPSQGEIR
jgi:NAD(P)-dependent dehydrogenase (short-subunit alcohol dehydrogenase family)